MGRRFCPRGWIRGSRGKGEGGMGKRLSDTVTLGTKTLGEITIVTTLHTSRREPIRYGFVGCETVLPFFNFLGVYSEKRVFLNTKAREVAGEGKGFHKPGMCRCFEFRYKN